MIRFFLFRKFSNVIIIECYCDLRNNIFRFYFIYRFISISIVILKSISNLFKTKRKLLIYHDKRVFFYFKNNYEVFN